jgi:hypothetical protein
MQGVLFGLFKDLGTAEKVHAQLLRSGISPEAAILHRQDVPIAGVQEERPGLQKPVESGGLMAGLVRSLFDSSGEMDDSSTTGSIRHALHRGAYAVSVSTLDASEMTMAEKLFTESGAVLQLHPDA